MGLAFFQNVVDSTSNPTTMKLYIISPSLRMVFLSVALFCSHISIWAQSTVRTCADDCVEMSADSVILAIDHCADCAELVLMDGDTLAAAAVLERVGDVLFSYGSLDSSLTYLSLSADYFAAVGADWQEAGCRSSMSKVYITNGQFELGLKELQQAIHLVEQPVFKDSIHPYYSHLGEVMYAIGELEQAVAYNKRGMELYTRFSKKFFYKATAYSLATVYIDLEEYERADSLLKYVADIEPEPEFALQSFLIQKRTEARFYYMTDDEEKSVDAYQAIRPIADTLGDFGLFVEVYIGLGNDYLYLDRYDEADEMFRKVLNESRLEDHAYFLGDALDSYAYFLDMAERYEQASSVKSQIIALKDSVFAQQRMRDIRELHLVDLEQDNFQLADDNTAKGELIEYYEEYQALLRLIIIISVVFILVLVTFAFYLYRTRKSLAESRRQLAVQNEKLAEVDAQRIQLMKIVGHDLRGPIWSLRNFVELLNQGKIADADLPNVQRYALQSVMETQYLLDELTDWAQTSGGANAADFEEIDLRATIDIILGAYKLHAAAKKVELNIDVPDELMVHSDQRALSTILRNLVENSIKHTESGSVKITSVQHKQSVDILIHDTGRGMDAKTLKAVRAGLGVEGSTGTEGELGKGIGMQSVRLLCEQIGVKLEVESELGVGTTVKIVGVRSEE